METETTEAPVQQPVKEQPPAKLSVDEFAAKIKAKYPDYAHIDNAELVKKITTKYPDYNSQIDYGQKKSPVDFTHGYQPTPQDIQQKQGLNDFQSGLDKSGTGSTASQSTPTDPHQQAIQRAKSLPKPEVVKQEPKPEEGITDKIANALYLPAFNQGVNDLLIKPFLGGSDFIGRTTDKLYRAVTGAKETPQWLYDTKGTVVNSLSKNLDKAYQQRDKPKNTVSEITEGAVGTVPLVASLFTGGGEASLASKAPQLVSKVTKLLATTTALKSYHEATEQGKDYTQSAKDAEKGGVEGAEQGLTLDAQMLLGGALGKGVVSKVVEKGLLKGGKAGEALLHALSTATIFGGTPVVKDLLAGQDIDTHEAVKNFGMGLMFEAMPVAKGLHNEVSDRIDESKQNTQAAQTAVMATAASHLHSESVLQTLIGHDKDQLQAINTEIPGSHEDLYAQSIEQGMKAYESKNPTEKRDLLANQLLLKTQGDVKFIAQHDNKELLDAVTSSDELEPAEKANLIDKITSLSKNEQTAPNTEIPAQQPADETASPAETVNQTDETTQNNQITNPTSNEKGSETTQEGQGDEETGTAEKGNEGQSIQKEGVNTSGVPDNAPEVTKPRYSIKGDKITKLPLAEHSELNDLLKEDGIDISHLKDAHNTQRDGGGDQGTQAATDAEAVQQSKNDSTGNAGKDRPGESAEGSKDRAGKTTFKKPAITGIRNKDVSTERGENVDRTHKSREQTDTEGRRLVDSGELDPDQFAKEIIDKPKPASTEEQAALRYHKVNLEKEQRRLSKDPTPDNAIEYARNEDRLEQNRKATEITGNEAARALGDRQGQILEDYSRIHILERAKMANGGELDPRDEKELTERTARIKDLENKLADREEEIRKLQDKNTVSKVKRTADTEERNAKREVTKASLRKEREGILADLHLIAKKARSSAGANKIPVDMIVPLTKLARNYVLDGAITISQVADKIYNDLKDHIEGITKDDIIPVVSDGFNDYLRDQNELRLSRAKKLQKNKLEKLKDENYEQKVFKKILVDNDYLNIRAEINREQQRVNKKIQDIENSKKSLSRKIVDGAVKYGRQAKLASVTVLGKLAATGLATIGLKPVTEGIGKGISAILPKIAKRSSVEGSVSRSSLKEAAKQTEGAAVSSISQAYARAFTLGMKDAYQELSQGGSNLTALYKERGATLPAEAKEFFGHLHSAIKAPVKRFSWELSYAKRVAKTIQAGLDPLEPVTDAQNRLNAYKDADKAIFMGDNEMSTRYENAVGGMEKSKSSIVRTTAAAFRILLPFVKVPTNIVLEGAKYSFGSISGTTRLAIALSKGLENLEPEEADIILEHLKKGSVGGAAMAIGFFNPKMFGGFYQQGKKEKVAPGHIKIGGVDIPAFLIEHPIFIAAQVGANFRQILDKNRHKDDKYPVATLATLSGLGYEVPQANEIKRLVDLTGDIKSMKKWEKFGAETLKGEIEPAFLQQLAQITDVKHGAHTTIPGLAFTDKTQQKRQATGKGMKKVVQTLETGVPGLRQNVPKK